jgi:hypothetical protein
MKGIAMDEDERATYDAARDIPEDVNDGYVTENEMDINDVLDGKTRMDFSHAGGEFQHILEEELLQKASYVYSLLLMIFLFIFLTGVAVLIHEHVEIASICGMKDSSDKWLASWMHTLPGKTTLEKMGLMVCLRLSHWKCVRGFFKFKSWMCSVSFTFVLLLALTNCL